MKYNTPHLLKTLRAAARVLRNHHNGISVHDAAGEVAERCEDILSATTEHIEIHFAYAHSHIADQANKGRQCWYHLPMGNDDAELTIIGDDDSALVEWLLQNEMSSQPLPIANWHWLGPILANSLRA